MKKLTLKESRTPYNISLNDALMTDEVVILEREGQPVAALIPMTKDNILPGEHDIDNILFKQLQEIAKERNISVGRLIHYFLRLALAISRQNSKSATYHDLDDLAGTWSAEEAEAFEAVITNFEKIDEQLWP